MLLQFNGGLQLYVFYRYWLYGRINPALHFTHRPATLPTCTSYGRINPAFHFTHQDNVDFVETINDQSQIYLLRKKPILLERMGERLGRDFINLAHCSTDEFFAFTSKHNKIIAKPPNKARGEDIRVITDPLDRTKSDELFTALVAVTRRPLRLHASKEIKQL